MTEALTDRQAEILRWIETQHIRDGYPPSFAEIGRNFGIASTNGVNDHMLALARKGYLVLPEGRKARSAVSLRVRKWLRHMPMRWIAE